jgi:hypothetical protein
VLADECHVAEQFAGADAAQNLLTRRGMEKDFHLTLKNEVGGEWRVAFGEDKVSWLESLQGHGSQKAQGPCRGYAGLAFCWPIFVLAAFRAGFPSPWRRGGPCRGRR